MDAVIKHELESDSDGDVPMPSISSKQEYKLEEHVASSLLSDADEVKCEYQSDPEYDEELRKMNLKQKFAGSLLPDADDVKCEYQSDPEYNEELRKINQQSVGSDDDSEDEDEHMFDAPTRAFIDMLNVAEDFAQEAQGAQSWAPESSASEATEAGSSAGPTVGPNLFDFVWETLPQPPIDPLSRRETFTGSSGPVRSYADPYEIFTFYWDMTIMSTIALETNRYAEQCLLNKMNKGILDGKSRLLAWKDTDVDELYVFFAVILATGVVIKSDLSEYWSVHNDIFDTPNFRAHMSYNRFIALGSMLHFVNNEEVDISQLSKAESKIFKIAPIVKHLNEKFQAVYQLGQCVALDHSLTQWKGWLSINQFNQNKGVKTYEVCDSNSGYLWRFKIDTGREDGDEEYRYITSFVLQLLQGLENKGHTIFMNNFYNSPALARLLKCQGFDCVGTISLNRQYVPTQLKSLVKSALGVGSVHGCTSGDVDVLVWKDRNLVSLLSTYHGTSSFARSGRSQPSVVHDYSVRMGGVHKKDQMLSTYPLERKRTSMWYKKFFRRLLNVSVLNSYIVYKESVPSTSNHQKMSHRQFRKALVVGILAKHTKLAILEQVEGPSNRVYLSKTVRNHLPQEYPLVEGTNRRQRGRCAVCKKRICMRCPGCNVALCLMECFAKYHTAPYGSLTSTRASEAGAAQTHTNRASCSRKKMSDTDARKHSAAASRQSRKRRQAVPDIKLE